MIKKNDALTYLKTKEFIIDKYVYDYDMNDLKYCQIQDLVETFMLMEKMIKIIFDLKS